MATYSNQHWLLSHIRNSFISTDDTGICETVMLSDDMPKQYLRKFQAAANAQAAQGTTQDGYRRAQQRHQQQQQRRSTDTASSLPSQHVPPRIADAPFHDVDFVCYPGLDLSDDEDLDTSTHSFDIQMYPEVGAHRFRSNTAQKLEKLDIAKRKAARIKSVNYNEEAQPPQRQDFFKRKQLPSKPAKQATTEPAEQQQSKLTAQLARSPQQTQNRFMEYARFDGTAQVGMPTKRINVYVNMLPEPERNYPLKICVLSTAKIIEVIGLVCYKASLQHPDVLQLKSVQHYALYMTEDNDDMDDFPPLDNREPCSKFGFSHLTLAERRPLAPVTRIDYHTQPGTKSMTSEEEDKGALADAAVQALQHISLNGDVPDSAASDQLDQVKAYEQSLLNHSDMMEAPISASYRLSLIDKRFFKCDVNLVVCWERIEIDQLKNVKFWTQKKFVSTPIEFVAYCEIVEQKQLKALMRIWLKAKSNSGLATSCTSAPMDASSMTLNTSSASPSSPPFGGSPFGLFGGQTIRFKHYDFDTDVHTAEKICRKLNCILVMRASELRKEFLRLRQRQTSVTSAGSSAKKQLKL
ncbi:Sin1 [Drosophila busckii]|uniref:Sin1 n=1 Tax=Drosophila busckii TaxID=30019 RepID=A0A0M3QVK1_DROBS|nr:stress-activated map kinase-interacting protein 1 [Drosophila busckii]ALC42533.1 Sin1 [Drosophila busckii]